MDEQKSSSELFVPPAQSRERLIALIKQSDHEGLGLDKIVDYTRQESLDFGPGVDVLDVLFSLTSLNLIRMVQGNPTRVFFIGH